MGSGKEDVGAATAQCVPASPSAFLCAIAAPTRTCVFLHLMLHSKIVRTLLLWYKRNARDFPWRRTRNPYIILVSEIMLQQTQADRVELLLPKFLKRFPSIEFLARARRASVIKAWRGMGYNRRAVHLHEAAQGVMANNGVFPSTAEELRKLRGVGKYTASALLCFAFGKRVAVVDVNIRRVLSRVTKRRITTNDLLDDRDAWKVASEFLPKKHWYEWNQALMDIGARFCKARSTACDECPLQSCCASANAVRSAAPVKKKSIEKTHKNIPVRIWRGKIVEALRGGTFSTMIKLGEALDAEFKKKDSAWLVGVIDLLERDGLVRRRGGMVGLA